MKKFSFIFITLVIVSIFYLPLVVNADVIGPHVYHTTTTAVGAYVSFTYERSVNDSENCYLEYDPTVLQYVQSSDPMYDYTVSNGKLMITLAKNEGLSGDQPMNPYVEFKVLDTTKSSTVVNIVSSNWPYNDGGIPAEIKITPAKTNNITCPECEKCDDAKECSEQKECEDAEACNCDKASANKEKDDSKFLYASLGANVVLLLGCTYFIISKNKKTIATAPAQVDSDK